MYLENPRGFSIRFLFAKLRAQPTQQLIHRDVVQHYQTQMKKHPIILIILIFALNFNLFSQNTITEKYSDKILQESKLRIATDKAIKYIKTNNSDSLIASFPKTMSSSISKSQISQLIQKINGLIDSEGIPKEDNIQPALKALPRGNDTLFVNQIYYRFKNKVLIFSFLQEFGPNKIAGMNLIDDPFSGNGVEPDFKSSEKFEYNLDKLTNFRIYYKQIKPITKFKNNLGVFAIEGNNGIFKESGLSEKFEPIIKELSKSKFEKKEIFNQLLDRGDNVEFIQAELGFENKDYGIFLYLPIKGGKISMDNIIFQQRQFANLGYQYTLLKENYPKIVRYLTEIIEMDLEKYYLINP